MSWISKKVDSLKESVNSKWEKHQEEKKKRAEQKREANEYKALQELKKVTSMVGKLERNAPRSAYQELWERKEQLVNLVGNSQTAILAVKYANSVFEIADRAIMENEEREAVNELRELNSKAAGIQKGGSRDAYMALVQRKNELQKKISGRTGVGKSALEETQEAFRLADDRLRSGEEEGKGQRHNLKREEAIRVINDHKGNALETLIARTKKLPVSATQNTRNNGNGNTAAQEADDALVSESKYQGGGNLSKRELFKRKLGFRSIKEKALYIARNWRKIMKEEHEKISDGLKNMFDFTSDAAGMGADIGDIQDMDEVMEGMLDADTSGGGLVSAVMGGLSGTLKYIRFVINLTKEMKKDMDAGTDVIHTRQERWGMARQYLHDVVDIFNGFKSGFGPMTKMIPFFNSITSLIGDGANMIVDVMDLVSSSIHIHNMRKEKKRIYQRIEEKRKKYAAGGRSEDALAEQAYTLEEGKGSKTEKVEEKRKILLGKVASSERIRVVTPDQLRSRNDSTFRNAQYGLGKRIRLKMDSATGTYGEKKSQKRQMEALQLMEEYREIEKSRKKMGKALAHNIESILKGGTSIVANGLKLTGEISAASGVGAGIYAAGMATGIGVSGYSLAREGGATVYGKIRDLIGTSDNKATTREDMAISLINKMEEVGISSVWNVSTGAKEGFKEEAALRNTAQTDSKDLVRQGRTVDHLSKVLYGGLDARISDLISSNDKNDLKEKIAESFSQG